MCVHYFDMHIYVFLYLVSCVLIFVLCVCLASVLSCTLITVDHQCLYCKALNKNIRI